MLRRRILLGVVLTTVVAVFLTDGITGGGMLPWRPDGASGASAPASVVPVCPPTISIGESITCSLASGNDVDAYTFAASAGDIALVRMAMGVSAPEVRLYSPGGIDPICSAKGFASVAEISSCTLPSDGTYIIEARSWVSTVGGGYSLHLQRLNGPANANAISYGDTASGSIDPKAEMDAYTFAGSAGDIVLVRMWSWAPVVRLYSSDGTSLSETQGGTGGSFAHIFDYTLPSDGTYSVLAGSWEPTVGGGYSLHLQRVSDPANPTSISYGDTVSGTIDPRAEMDPYTFIGSAGDIVLVRMWSWAPVVWLYDQDGSYLTGDQGEVESSFAHIFDYTLPSDGTYTILAGRWLETGGYSLHLQRVSDPANSTSISYGDTVSGTIDPEAEMDAYTFAGSAGDIVLVRMSSWAPVVWLYDQDGSYLTGDQGGEVASVAEISDFELPSDGTYTILAGRWRETGGYTLSLGGPLGDGDSDGDGVPDVSDNCPATANPNQENNVHPGTPEGDHCEDPDADGLFDIDDPCPDNPDCDGDSLGLGDPFGLFLRDGVEDFIGTLVTVACAATPAVNDEDPDALGPDWDDSQGVDGSDLFLFAERFGTELGVPPPIGKQPYWTRFDIYPTDASLHKIDGSDLFVLASYFGNSCP